MLAQFQERQERYPLPSGWMVTDQLCETLELEGSAIDLSGFVVTGPGGEAVTGSAASDGRESSSVDRAYFEALERVSVVVAMSGEVVEMDLRDRNSAQVGTMSRSAVFT